MGREAEKNHNVLHNKMREGAQGKLLRDKGQRREGRGRGEEGGKSHNITKWQSIKKKDF